MLWLLVHGPLVHGRSRIRDRLTWSGLFLAESADMQLSLGSPKKPRHGHVTRQIDACSNHLWLSKDTYVPLESPWSERMLFTNQELKFKHTYGTVGLHGSEYV